MTDTTTPAIIAPETPLEEFPTALLLQLPNSEAFEREDDFDYDPQALAAWAGERAMAYYQAGVDFAQKNMQPLLEASSAAGTVETALDCATYLHQLSSVLKTNLSLSDQWDLGRTIEQQRVALLEQVSRLVQRYPFVGEEIATRNAQPGLVVPAGSE